MGGGINVHAKDVVTLLTLNVVIKGALLKECKPKSANWESSPIAANAMKLASTHEANKDTTRNSPFGGKHNATLAAFEAFATLPRRPRSRRLNLKLSTLPQEPLVTITTHTLSSL